jgi:hypothetical protein
MNMLKFLGQDPDNFQNPKAALDKGDENPYKSNDGWFGPFPVTSFRTDVQHSAEMDKQVGITLNHRDDASSHGPQSGYDALSDVENAFHDQQFTSTLPPSYLGTVWMCPNIKIPVESCTCSEELVSTQTGAPCFLEDGSDSGNGRMAFYASSKYDLDLYDCQLMESEDGTGSHLHFFRKEPVPSSSTGSHHERFAMFPWYSAEVPNEAKMTLSGRNEDGSLKGLVWMLV